MLERDFDYVGIILEGVLYGLYSGIFAMYILHHHASENGTGGKMKNILFYALCLLYILSLATIVLDTTKFATATIRLPIDVLYPIQLISGIINGCCDYVSQSILIYRCWIVWGRNIRVVIIPLILTIAFLAMWLAAAGSVYFSSYTFLNPDWAEQVILSCLVISITVNALVMGLIIFKIFKVFREVKATLDERTLGATGGRKLRSVMFVLIESGAALFSIQLARVLVTIPPTDAAGKALQVIVTIHQMLNGITPTIILVRVSMGLSFHDEQSMEEATASLHFVHDHPNPTTETETGSISAMHQESRDDDIDVQPSKSLGLEYTNNQIP